MQEQIIPTNPEDAEAQVPVEPELDVIQGINATIEIGEVTTLAPGSAATVTNVGTPTHAKLDFGIPEGEQGETGSQGIQGPTGPQGPQGPQGIQGETGPTGPQGPTGPTGPQGPQGIQGIQGIPGKDFSIYKTYASVAEMNADAANVPEGEFVMIASTTEDPDNAKLYVKNGEGSFTYLSDLSGAQGIQGPQGEQGVQGPQGIQGPQGPVGNTGSVKSQYVQTLPATGAEDTFYITDKDVDTGTVQGNPVQIVNNNTAGQIVDFKLGGDASQTTYSGKNLYNKFGDLAYPSTAYMDATTLQSNGTLKTTANYSSNASKGYKLLNYSANTTYCFSGKLVSSTGSGQSSIAVVRIMGHNGSNWSAIKNWTLASTGDFDFTFNTGTYSDIFISLNSNGTTGSSYEAVYDNIQIEQSATKTDYEPYCGGIPSPNPDYPQDINVVTGTQTIDINGTSYPINLGNIWLAEVGAHQDGIKKTDGKWYIEKQTGKVVLDGSETWNYVSSDNGYFQFNTPSMNVVPFDGNPATNALCDHFTPRSRWYVSTGKVNLTINLNGSYCAIRYETYPPTAQGLADFKTWLSNNKPTVYYALATPTTTEITDTNLINQLEAIVQTELYTGQNNISNSTASPNLAGDFEITYQTWQKYNKHNVYIWNDAINDWQIIVGLEGQ